MAITSLSNEQELILLISKGDKRAFTTLFDWYCKPLASYIFKLTESLEVTEDIVQDVFIKVWMNRENLHQINNLSNYLFILSKNQTLNQLRKMANYSIRFQSLENNVENYEHFEESNDEYEDFRALVDKAIESLPQQQKKIYQLSKFDKLKHEEIAKQLNLSVETVKKHAYLATKTIKEYLKQHMDDVLILILLSFIPVL